MIARHRTHRLHRAALGQFQVTTTWQLDCGHCQQDFSSFAWAWVKVASASWGYHWVKMAQSHVRNTHEWHSLLISVRCIFFFYCFKLTFSQKGLRTVQSLWSTLEKRRVDENVASWLVHWNQRASGAAASASQTCFAQGYMHVSLHRWWHSFTCVWDRSHTQSPLTK